MTRPAVRLVVALAGLASYGFVLWQGAKEARSGAIIGIAELLLYGGHAAFSFLKGRN